jgi:hypothetical protein
MIDAKRTMRELRELMGLAGPGSRRLPLAHHVR